MFQRKTRAGRIAGASCSRGMIAAAFAGLAVAAVAVPRAGADVTVYANDTTVIPADPNNPLAGALIQPSGQTDVVGTGTYTPLIADDITPISGYAGQTVTSVQFDLGLNEGAGSSVTFDTELRFYDTTGPGGGPGNLLYSVNTTPLTLTSQTVQPYEILLTSGGPFTLPSGTFWAGLSFTDGGGTTGATADELSNIGLVYFDPPTVGSSADEFFQANNGGLYTGNDPAGGIYSSATFGGGPATDFGFGFTVASAVPEPASLGLIGVAAAAGLVRRRRRVQI